MPTSQIYEIIGYVASGLVAISLMMSSILKLRILNLIGSAFFTAYGLLIHAYPVAAMNFFVVLIDLYYLRQMLSSKEFFRLLEVRADSEYLHAFLDFYNADIQRFQPGFAFQAQATQVCFFVLRNMVPAGLIIGEIQQGDTLYLHLDYAIPGYRDLKIANFLYREHAQEFLARGIHSVVTRAGAAHHASYLRQMGFTPQPASQGGELYALNIAKQ